MHGTAGGLIWTRRLQSHGTSPSFHGFHCNAVSIRYFLPPTWVFSGELCVTAADVAVDGMDTQGSWRAGTVASRLSYKNATLALCAINVLAVALLRNHFSAWPRLPGGHRFDSAQLRYIWESEELRRAMEPVDLIRRVKEIEQESFGEHGMSTQEDPKQTAAVDLSKRLKDLRQGNDGSSQRALEEWRKRKMERARQRAIDKDGMMPGGAKTR